MQLKELLKGLDYTVIEGNEDISINSVTYDSREVKENGLFICIDGFKTDGHKYAKKAIENGAGVIVCQKDLIGVEHCTIIKVEDTRKAMAIIAANFYGNPSQKLRLIGITGTNGKTTSTYMVKAVLEAAGYKVGLIGTIANYIGDKRLAAERTTPESLELHKLFSDMVKDNVDYCVMEVSSHSLSLSRVYGLVFDAGIFTNLTQDHLDFHNTFENYYSAKLELFKISNTLIVNGDDEYGRKIVEDTGREAVTYGIDTASDVRASDLKLHSRGINFLLKYKDESVDIELPIPGKYNVYNALACAAVCIKEKLSLDLIKRGLEAVQVPGRCEIVTKAYNLGFEVIVDYAHTPDGLENILTTAREFTEGRLISVFGCGGDRDKTKRPIMGKIGSELSDLAIVTSDNPRSEEPMSIIKDILSGIHKDNYLVIENRREGIKGAMEIAREGDVIVVAGKGHEDYQILKDRVLHFDEREVIDEIVKELFGGNERCKG